MTDLPRGWAIGPLSDFITPRGEKVSPSSFPELPFIGMDHVEAHTTRILGSVPASELKSNAARFFENDVLYGRLRPYLNKVAQPKFDGLASAEFIIFGGNELIHPAFLRHRLNARDFVTFATSLNAGDRPRVNFEQIGDFEILVPPLNEQRRIVEKIEAMFDEIDKGVESLQTARTTLGLYRQSLLKSAFEGRLTADWRAQNADKLEAPETLLARIQKERDTRYKSALDAWQDALATWRADGEKGKKPAKPKRPSDLDPKSGITLGHVVLDVAQGWSPKCENHASCSDDVWGVIKTTAIQPAKFLPQENKELPKNLQSREWLELSQGDVLITRAGPRTRVGVACMVKRTRPRLMLCDKAYRLNYLATLVLPEFLEAYLNAPDTQRRIEVIKSGINDSGLNLRQEQFLALEFWLPSMAEQAEIARILDARLEAADALDAEIDAALTRADALRQSILKKAFSGQLVLQNPEDEPASALLERIKAVRAKTLTKSRRRAMA